MAHRIVNIDALEFVSRPKGYAAPANTKQKFDARVAQVASVIGAKKLGYNVTEIPPGAAAFPFHSHLVNEEMFFVLDGSGEVRFADARLPLRKGDIVACPPGDQSTAHQIINTGNAPLRFLAVSTLIDPEICEYPDSQKFSVSEKQRNADGTSDGFRHVGRLRDKADYWEGE
ncbi:MAG TPA: cupin domain-containing protein [Rudaea sp.]|jgi:uncharacterized cupin superfamily protein|nr:cupin domain-containing protein [Rudaea sp.]